MNKFIRDFGFIEKAVCILFVIVMTISCNQQEEELDVIAQVNQEKLKESDLKQNYSEAEWEKLSQDEKKELVQDWIELTLLAQEADQIKLSEEATIKNKIQIAEKNIKANALIAQRLSTIDVSEDDLFNYYRVHKSKYQKSHVEYKVQRIFVTDEQLLPDIRDEIANSNFKEAAQKYSQESIGNNGGYMGFVAKGSIEPILWNTLVNLGKYKYKTVKVDNGYYIIRYYDVRNVKTQKTFVEVVDEIRTTLIRARKEEVFDELIESLKKKSEISISI